MNEMVSVMHRVVERRVVEKEIYLLDIAENCEHVIVIFAFQECK